MRWAEFHFASSECQLQILMKVILEYRALAAVGAFSPTARTQLRMLHRFLRRSDVQHVLWLYIDYFFSHWDKMSIAEIGMCQTVFEVCLLCCEHLKKKPPPVIQRMGELLRGSHAVQRLFAQADATQRRQREQAVRDKDWVVYADAGSLTAQEVLRRNIVKHAIGDEPGVCLPDDTKRKASAGRLASVEIPSEPPEAYWVESSSEEEEEEGSDICRTRSEQEEEEGITAPEAAESSEPALKPLATKDQIVLAPVDVHVTIPKVPSVPAPGVSELSLDKKWRSSSPYIPPSTRTPFVGGGPPSPALASELKLPPAGAIPVRVPRHV